jgi:uncharacterized membrane protein
MLYAANLLFEIFLGLGAAAFKPVPALSIAVFILISVLEFGVAGFYLQYAWDGRIIYKWLGISYSGGIKRFFRHLVTFIIKYLIILFAATLLIIPALIKHYSYSQIKYIRASHTDLGIFKCLYVSKSMMRGHKIQLFLADLSFIPLFILSALTGGLLLIYLIPYRSVFLARYHVYLQESYNIKKDINREYLTYFTRYIYKLT